MLPTTFSLRLEPSIANGSVKPFPVRWVSRTWASSSARSSIVSPALSCPPRSESAVTVVSKPRSRAKRSDASMRPSPLTTTGSAGAVSKSRARRAVWRNILFDWVRMDSPIKMATVAPTSQSAIKMPISAIGRPVPVMVMRPLCCREYANAQMLGPRNEKSPPRFRSGLIHVTTLRVINSDNGRA